MSACPMDPLSIASGVVGIVTAAAQITSLLIKFTRSTRNAPEQARQVMIEVSDISAIISQLQSYLIARKTVDSSRTSLLKADHLVGIISGCVMTFSELEKLLDETRVNDMGVIDRVNWVRKETEILGVVQRLQDHKASLSCILNVLNGETIIEAKKSVDQLCHLFSEQYQQMSSRMIALEQAELKRMIEAPWVLQSYSTVTESKIPNGHHQDSTFGASAATESEILDFQKEPDKSRVSMNVTANRMSRFSVDPFTKRLSCLSSFSVAEVSNLSEINLVVTAEEVHNPRRFSQSWVKEEQSKSGLLPRMPFDQAGSPVLSPIEDVDEKISATSSDDDWSDSSSIDTLENDIPIPQASCQVCKEEIADHRYIRISQGYFCNGCCESRDDKELNDYRRDTLSWVTVLFDREAKKPGELVLREGDVIRVLSHLGSGWWDGMVDGTRGWFPSNFVTEMTYEQIIDSVQRL